MANIAEELNPTTENGDSARIKINGLMATLNVLFKKDANGNVLLNRFPKSKDVLPYEEQTKLETFAVSQDKTKLEISKNMELDHKQTIPTTQDLIEASQVLATIATVSELVKKASVTLTASQVKSLYEQNQDTNVFSDGDKSNITVAFNRLAAIGLVGPAAGKKNTKSQRDIEIPTQTISKDPQVVANDDRLITVANAFAIEASLKAYADQAYMPMLNKINPTMKLKVADTGLAAQMQVVYKGHDVASMEWLKSSGSFVFSLADKDTGVTKATFEIKTDGKAYVNGKQIVSMQDLDNSGVMFARGIVTDVNDITTTGIYEGVNVTNAPVTGAIIIEAYKDAAGDIDLTLKDSTMRRYEGGKQAGSNAVWHNVQSEHLYGSVDPADTLGQDGDLYFKTV